MKEKIGINILSILVICTIIILGLVFNKNISMYVFKNKTIVEKDTIILKDTVYISYAKTLQVKPTILELREVLKFYNIKHPDVVLAQAILETGWFESDIFKTKNNLFGLFNSRKKDFFSFNHWSLSVKGYRDLFQYKYTPTDNATDEDYIKFLKKAGYAEDPDYTKKIRVLTNHLIDNYTRI